MKSAFTLLCSSLVLIAVLGLWPLTAEAKPDRPQSIQSPSLPTSDTTTCIVTNHTTATINVTSTIFRPNGTVEQTETFDTNDLNSQRIEGTNAANNGNWCLVEWVGQPGDLSGTICSVADTISVQDPYVCVGF